jgi:hypothetical protein
MLQRNTTEPNVHDIWQFKIIFAILDRYKQIQETEFLFSKELLKSIMLKFRTQMEAFFTDNVHLLKLYITPTDDKQHFNEFCIAVLQRLVSLVVYYDLPASSDPICRELRALKNKNSIEVLLMMRQQNIKTDVIYNLMKIISNT